MNIPFLAFLFTLSLFSQIQNDKAKATCNKEPSKINYFEASHSQIFNEDNYFDPIPCNPPTGVIVSNVEFNTAIVSWMPTTSVDFNEYIYEIRTSGIPGAVLPTVLVTVETSELTQ